MMKSQIKLCAGVALVAMAAACTSGPTEPLVDGSYGPNFAPDLAECRQLSQQKSNGHGGAATGVVIGGLAGAEDDVEGVVAGALIGGLLGSAADKSETNKMRDAVVINCMRGRGHNVVG